MDGSERTESGANPESTFPCFRYFAALIAILTAILYFPVIKDLVGDWWNDSDYTYAFLVPPFVAYVIWHGFDGYRKIEVRPNHYGLPVLLAALLLLFIGKLGADYFISRFSLWILIVGLVLYLFGWRMLRSLAFPLSYLLLTIPLPGIIHNEITFPLQLFCSRAAASLIDLMGVPVFREGNILKVPHYTVEVAQACSGIRSLLALVAMGIGYGYFAERRLWVRAALVALMIPIALFTNSLRIMAVSLLGYAVDPSWAEGFAHLFSGWVIFLLALVLLFLAHSLIERALAHGVRRHAHA
jgi:exosortase